MIEDANRRNSALLVGGDWRQLLARDSFLERDARARVVAILDAGTMRELCGPFDRLESPWLTLQGITPQSDDGTVIARGTIDGQPVVVVSIEQKFLGGGTGEVSGAKISQAIRLATNQTRAGARTAAVLLLESGGVRLQEANLGLNAIAEICAAVLDLRPLAPVVGVVAGPAGCFGGISIAAGLCTRLVVTPEARIGLNGPAVIEEESGIEEFDSNDRDLIWAIDGGERRHASGQADILVPDDSDAVREAVAGAIRAGAREPGEHRSERLNALAAQVDAHAPRPQPDGDAATVRPTSSTPGPAVPLRAVPSVGERGRTWMRALANGGEPDVVIDSVLRADTGTAVYLAVVPDPDNRFPRARRGQVGLTESLALAQAVRAVIASDAGKEYKRAIVAVVDLPSQAYGRTEEAIGLHLTIAASVDAYAAARVAGHPIVALVVGTALSGGFLAHGLQANQILALDDPDVEIHAMHKQSAARITRRTVAELDQLSHTILPMSYDVRDWARLGFCDGLLQVDDADRPTPQDMETVAAAILAAADRARTGPRDLSNRLESTDAVLHRAASRAVRDLLARQWDGDLP